MRKDSEWWCVVLENMAATAAAGVWMFTRVDEGILRERYLGSITIYYSFYYLQKW